MLGTLASHVKGVKAAMVRTSIDYDYEKYGMVVTDSFSATGFNPVHIFLAIFLIIIGLIAIKGDGIQTAVDRIKDSCIRFRTHLITGVRERCDRMLEEEAKVVPTTYDATNQTDILPTAEQTSQTAAPTYRDAAVQATPEPTLEHTHCVRGTQTPAALRPLPIAKLKVGDESGWYLSKSKNADGSRVIHFSDSRSHETRSVHQEWQVASESLLGLVGVALSLCFC